MKRLIILLLLLSCFRFSYAQELTAEQQQLAWKFIFDNMLSKDYLPNIYKTDIIINLKGEITSADSIIVNDIIRNFRTVIPYLKIELSDKRGNLILGMNDGKKNSVTTNMETGHEITSQEMNFPANLTDIQRKQFIYYNLFRGLTFCNWQKKPFAELSGCVFAENDFDSITFSPFDLFILEKLYAPDFPIQLVMNYPLELQITAWNSIRTRFLGDKKEPIIYRTDIAIKLDGIVSSADSACMNKLIDELKLIIPTRKIFLTKENANVVFKLLSSNSGTVSNSTKFGTSLL